MGEDGTWRLSPAYDMVYAYNPEGGWTATHQMSVNGHFDNITRQDLISFAQQNNIREASLIIDEICDAVSQWPEIANKCEVPSQIIEHVSSNINMDF